MVLSPVVGTSRVDGDRGWRNRLSCPEILFDFFVQNGGSSSRLSGRLFCRQDIRDLSMALPPTTAQFVSVLSIVPVLIPLRFLSTLQSMSTRKLFFSES